MDNIISILSKTQDEIYEYFFNKKFDGFDKIIGDKYILLTSPSPKPLLCVHLDTINTHSKDNIKPTVDDFVFDSKNNIISLSPLSELSCLGGDDRAGLYIALKLIDYMNETDNFKYDIGFFIDEEIGCIGSGNLSLDLKENLIEDFSPTCFIGLDRKSGYGKQEVALYGYDNDELTKLFTEYGFKESIGSITDASELANDIACVNLSVGYDNEHTKNEVLYVDCMENTLQVLKDIEIPNKVYESKDNIYVDNYFDYYDVYYDELEEENKIFRGILWSLGFDPDDLLDQHKFIS